MNPLDSHSDVTRVESLVAGGMAGLLARLFIAPLDLLKIRLQLHGDPVMPTVRNILKTEGIRAFWKGNVPAEALYFAYNMSQFATLRTVNHLLRQAIPSDKVFPEQARQLIAGGTAGAVATLTTYPFDYLRTRVAANQKRGVLMDTVRQIWHTHGLKGFYHGSTATIISVYPYMALFFSSYSYLRDDTATFRPPSWLPEVFTASSIAAIFSKSAVYPLDTIRKRIQVHGSKTLADSASAGSESGIRYSHSVLRCGAQIAEREGIKGLYRGLSVAIVKVLPGSFLAIFFYEWSLQNLRAIKATFKLS